MADAEQLTAWLAEHVAERDRRPERLREELLARCRRERIEPPAPARIERIVRSALHASEEALASRVTLRLTDDASRRIAVLLAVTDDDAIGAPEVDVDGDRAALGTIKEAPGSVSPDTMLAEIDKLLAVRAIGVAASVFADVAPNVVAGWRARAAVESPSHLRHASRGVASDARGGVAARARARDHRHAR